MEAITIDHCKLLHMYIISSFSNFAIATSSLLLLMQSQQTVINLFSLISIIHKSISELEP